MAKKILPFLNTNKLGNLLLFIAVLCAIPNNSLLARSKKSHKPAVLSLFPSMWLGGAEVCCAIMHEYLYHANRQSSILVLKNSPLSTYLQVRNLPHYTAAHNGNFAYHLKKICLEKKINIVQCHTAHDAQLSLQATRKLPVKVVLMYHGTQDIPFEQMKGLAGVMSTSPENVDLIKAYNTRVRAGFKKVLHLFPFFDEKPFLNYKQSSEPASAFFKKNYGFSLEDNEPVICMVANFYQDADITLPEPPFRKNHLLLLKALAKLVHERGKKAHIVFVGGCRGSTMRWHQDFCKKLNIEAYVHFLGFCDDVRPILFHSTIHALTSREEPLGIVYLEASLMKKPSIGSSGTGAEHTIVNGKTGFIFKNNDVDDLANKLEMLLDNRELCTTMGLNAFQFIMGKNHFEKTTKSPFINAQKMPALLKFYRSIL